MYEYLISIGFFIVIFLKVYLKHETIIVSIDGNIGSGKSTLVEYLKNNCQKEITIMKYFIFPKSFKIKFLQEPVDEWLSIKGINDENILDCFYEDKTRYAYLFQNFAFITRYNLLKSAINKNENQIIFIERSTETDKNVFAKMLHSKGDMCLLEYKIYNYWYKLLKIPIDKEIYLDVNPSICHDRIMNRGRESEESINVTYLSELKLFHDKWLLELPKNKVKIINGNNKNTKEYLKNLKESIINFVKN